MCAAVYTVWKCNLIVTHFILSTHIFVILWIFKKFIRNIVHEQNNFFMYIFYVQFELNTKDT